MAVLASREKQQLRFPVSTLRLLSLPAVRMNCERTNQSVTVAGFHWQYEWASHLGKRNLNVSPLTSFFFFTMKMGHFLVHLEFCNKADTVCAIIRMGGMLSCMESDIVRGSVAGILSETFHRLQQSLTDSLCARRSSAHCLAPREFHDCVATLTERASYLWVKILFSSNDWSSYAINRCRRTWSESVDWTHTHTRETGKNTWLTNHGSSGLLALINDWCCCCASVRLPGWIRSL